MKPDYKMLFEEAMSLNAHLENELDLTEEYALEVGIRLEKLLNNIDSADVATWGVNKDGEIINMLTQ
tara:strand:- start:63 stop:263 length:201 start_codon:yes stop_codon:yes gene_type:complete